MPPLSRLPSELLLKIFGFEIPQDIRTYEEYRAYISERPVNKAPYKAATEAFWKGYVAEWTLDRNLGTPYFVGGQQAYVGRPVLSSGPNDEVSTACTYKRVRQTIAPL